MLNNCKRYKIVWDGFELTYVPKDLPRKYEGFEMTLKLCMTMTDK